MFLLLNVELYDMQIIIVLFPFRFLVLMFLEIIITRLDLSPLYVFVAKC